MSDAESKLITIDEEANHEIVHRCRFRKANRATHEPLDAGAQIEVFVVDFLRALLPTAGCSGSIWRSEAPQPSVEKRRIPKGSSPPCRGTKTVSFRRLQTSAHTGPLWRSIACHHLRGAACVPT